MDYFDLEKKITGEETPEVMSGKKGAIDYNALAEQAGGRNLTNTTHFGAPIDDEPSNGLMTSVAKTQGQSKLTNFAKFIGDLFIGAGKGVVSTVKGASELGEQILQAPLKAAGMKFGDESSAQTLQNRAEEALKLEQGSLTEAKGTGQKIGKFAEQVGEFFVPGGAIAKGTKALEAGLAASKIGKAAEAGSGAAKIATWLGKLGAKVAPEALSGAGVTALQTGDVKKGAEAGAITAAAIPVLGGLGKVAGEVTKLIASKFSGVPTAAIEHAFTNPTMVRQGIKTAIKEGEMAPAKILEDAKDALGALKQARREAYEADLQGIKDSIQITKKGTIYVKDKNNVFVPTKFSLKGLKDEITKTLGQFKIDTSRGVFDETAFAKSPLPKAMQKDLQELTQRVYAWDDITPLGLDDLRQVIASYEKGGIAKSTGEKQFNKIVGDLRRNVSSYVNERIPLIGEMNKKYAAASDTINSVIQNLNLGENVKPTTAMRTLTNIFSPRSAYYKEFVEKLGEDNAKKLMSDIAGTLFAKWIPEGLSGMLSAGTVGYSLANPWALLVAPFASPRIVGSGATAAGKIAPAVKGLIQKGTAPLAGQAVENE